MLGKRPNSVLFDVTHNNVTSNNLYNPSSPITPNTQHEQQCFQNAALQQTTQSLVSNTQQQEQQATILHKRTRYDSDNASMNSDNSSNSPRRITLNTHNSNNGNTNNNSSLARDQSPFISLPIEVDIIDLQNQSKRRIIQHNNNNNGQTLYTEQQVKRILYDALKRQQEQLREEYDKTLNQLLREQFDSFSSFNRDYVSRHLAKSDFSYLS